MSQHFEEVILFTTFLDNSYNAIIKKLKKLNKQQLIILSENVNFISELKGLDKEINRYFNNYDLKLKALLSQAKGIVNPRDIAAAALLIKKTDIRNLFNMFRTWSDRFEGELFKGIVGNLNKEDIIRSLLEVPLVTARLSTFLDTSDAQFTRLMTRKIFSLKPEQRFKYSGGLIPTSSEICTDLFLHQKPEGYTMKQIDNLIPAGGGFVNASGRIPNYNCIHTWVIV